MHGNVKVDSNLVKSACRMAGRFVRFALPIAGLKSEIRISKFEYQITKIFRSLLPDLRQAGIQYLPRPQKATALAVDECGYGRDVVPLSPAVREANRRN